MSDDLLKQNQEADERAQLMFDSVPLACRLWNKDFKIIDCNEETLKLFQLKSKQEYLERYFEMSPEYQPDGQLSRDLTFKILKEVFAEGKRVFEWTHKNTAGELIPCEITLIKVNYKGEDVIAGYTRDLREIKAATAHMREADERTQIMLDATPLSCCLINKEYKYIDCNKEAEKLFDVSDKQELIGKFFEFSPEYQPDGQKSTEKALGYFKKAFEEGVVSLEWQHLIDGELIPCEVTLVRVNYKDDYIIAGYTRDLREIKAATAKMREADERTQILFDTAPIACCMFDKDLNIFDCNYETVKLFKIPNKQVFLERFFDLSPVYQPNGKKSDNLAREEIIKTLKEGYNRFSWVHQTMDGETLPSEITLVRVKFKGEYVIASYVRDLREQKALLNEIHNDMERYKDMAHWYESLLDSIPFFILSQDLNENLTYVNSSAEAFLGKRWDEIIGLPCKNLGLSICDTENCAVNCTKRGKMRTHFIHEDNSYQVDTKLLEDISGNDIGYIEVIQDITKTEHLLKQQAEAEAASVAKSSFLSTMSHEMRTPMNAIIGMTTVGKNATDMEHKDYAFAKIENASKHLLGIINDVLDMSKIEANKLELSHSAFELNHSLHQAVSLVQFSLDEKHIQFLMTVDENIPSFFTGDEQRLTQVITNLLSNAVKFTPEKGFIRLDVFLIGGEGGIYELRFEVTDNGIGISPEQQAKIFHAFEQADSGTTRRFGGTGLGLVISKRIVELMNGRIWIESDLGKGAKFIFIVKLPVSKEKLEHHAGPDETGEIKIDDIHDKVKGKRILIVEDIEINREVLVSLLDGTGLIIDTAENGRDAVDMVIVAPDKYDLIFMDMQMPIMDGLEATHQIRAIEKQFAEKKAVESVDHAPGKSKRVPIIAMTANVFQEDIDKCRAAGMDDHVGKPLEVEKVLEKLREYL